MVVNIKRVKRKADWRITTSPFTSTEAVHISVVSDCEMERFVDDD
jgi:hypothetical protein